MVWQAALLLAAMQPLADVPALTFSRARAFEPESIEVRVARLPRDREASEAQRFERIVTREGAPRALAWTSSEACPAAAAVLARQGSIEMPRLENPRTDGMLVTAFDGASYVLETTAFYGAAGRTGKIRLESNVGTSLARWIDEMLAALAPCWSAEPPDIGERPLTSH
ncbi:MAG TPA: hypothetical protein VLK25_02005 [Allosphingosinicella sp.]|nr:hypothetical protein [Allosphingosinicella sp.]